MDTISIRQSLLRLTPIGFRKIKKIKAPSNFFKSFKDYFRIKGKRWLVLKKE